MSERRACRLASIGRATLRYAACADRNAVLRSRLRQLAEIRRRFGYRRLHVLLSREGWAVNHKRIERLYSQEQLSLRNRHRRRLRSSVRLILATSTRPNQHWAMDFVHDRTIGGRRLRVLTIIDRFSREAIKLPVRRNFPARAVIEVLERPREEQGLPQVISTDNGSEFTSRAFDAWRTAAASKYI